MSGIFGIYERHGAPVDPADLGRMAESLEALGRDGRSHTGTESVRFGHYLMDRAPAGRSACQAQYDAGPDLYLTGDLRLDNRDVLAAELGVPGAELRTMSDSVLVSRAYERWGPDCPAHLLGDFAFAIWDQRRRRLVLARDHFGVRPLFYTTLGSTFFFASALRGLLAHPGVARTLDPFMVARYLILACDSGGPTLYSSIRSLVPSHCLVVESDRAPRLHRYWWPDPDARIHFRDDRDYVAGFREILEGAVRDRIDSPSPIGVLVSGGLDSSAVTAVASDSDRTGRLIGLGHVTEPGAPAADLDERRHLEALESHIPGLDLRYVTAAEASPLDGADEIHRCLRLPVQAGLNYVHRSLFEAARQAGCGVVLSGIGGDEVASVEGRILPAGLFWSLDPRRIARELAAERDLLGVSTLGIVRQALAAQLPRFIWHAVHYRRRGYLGYVRTCLREDLARSLDLRTALNDRGGWWDLTGYAPPSLRDELHLTAQLLADEGLDSQNLVTQATDYDLSLRFPLADIRLIEYCLAVPADQMRRGGEGRRLMRRATEGLLPEAIRQRRDKRVFGPDFLLRVQAEVDRIRQVIARFRHAPAFARYIDTKSLDRTLDRVSKAEIGSPEATWDCLVALLPACYLGFFLELEEATSNRQAPDGQMAGSATT